MLRSVRSFLVLLTFLLAAGSVTYAQFGANVQGTGSMSSRSAAFAENSLYEPLAADATAPAPAVLKLIPYYDYAFANRAETPMQVWMRYTES